MCHSPAPGSLASGVLTVYPPFNYQWHDAEPSGPLGREERSEPLPEPLAVIDVGSNSGRAVVLQLSPNGHLEILAGGKAPLRLARDIGRDGVLSELTIDRVIGVLHDFKAVADGAGATRVMAVATAAVRESGNGADLRRRALREVGLRIKVVDGDEEARYSLIGAISGLPVDHGLLMDIGGGSLEMCHFRDRQFQRAWTLPLGALRTSDRFLPSDPPTKREIEELGDHVRSVLTKEGVPSLDKDEHLVGTGGTIRNLAKIDRRTRSYPIPRLHAYVLTRGRAQDLADDLASRPMAKRRSVPGLSGERIDSIAGGALVAALAIEHTGAAEVVVSGQGLREGLAFEALSLPTPSASEARQASLAALTRRFATWDAERARRRQWLASLLLDTVQPDAGPSFRERLDQAALVLDIGRSIDHYRRYEHTADMLVAADLAGFSHRKLALLAAVVRQAGDEGMRTREYRPLLGSDDHLPVARAGAILALVDEIEHRIPPGEEEQVTCRSRGKTVELGAPLLDPWRREALAARFRRAFGRSLAIEPREEREHVA